MLAKNRLWRTTTRRLIDSHYTACDKPAVTPTLLVTTCHTKVDGHFPEHTPTPFLQSHIRFQAKWLVCTFVLSFSTYFYDFSAAIYTVYTSPNHPSVPNHLPTLIVTPHGMLQPDFCDHILHSDTLLNRQANLQISSTRISTRTSCVPVPKTLEAPSNYPLRNRIRRTTC